MAMKEYENLTEDEMVWADHCFESGNFEALAKLQELSAERAGKIIKVLPGNVLKQHTIQESE